MTTVYEGDSDNPRKMSGKAILAEMDTRRDEVHLAILHRLQDECDHTLWPWVDNDAGVSMCAGCSRTKAQQVARQAELAARIHHDAPAELRLVKPAWTVADFKAWQEMPGGG